MQVHSCIHPMRIAAALQFTLLIVLALLSFCARAATEGSEGAAWAVRHTDASGARGWETPGELLDLRDGSYGFEVTDLVVPGTAGLDLEVVRSYDKRRLVGGDDRLLGLWDLEIPRIVTMGLPGTGAVGTAHCIYARNPPQDHVVGSNWWAGAT
ncbi:MAG TPA: hypothetical protein VLT59_15490, partial [Steroidobacteraceae bacterium]|nr:hypothetical protein [Steroidobacteraceae bacterium]